MKIISETKTGVLVDMPMNEIRQIVSSNSLPPATYGSELVSKLLGKTVPINAIVEQASKLPKLMSRIVAAQLELRQIADDIEPIKPIIESIVND